MARRACLGWSRPLLTIGGGFDMIILMKNILKTIISFFLVFLFAPFTICAEKTASTAKKDNFFVLDNGLVVYLQQRDHVPLVNIAFAVNVGSKNEDAGTSGLVHILEHLIFLGETEFHKADEMNREMRQHGVQFNAHTSHDLMTIEASLPAQSWEFGLRLIKEKVFHLKFSQERLDKEKKIIFEEIAQHQDNPVSLGTNLALQHLFKNHPYQRPISGDRQVIEKASIEEIQAFYQRYFIPSNCAVAVVGDVNLDDIDKSIREVFGKIKKHKSEEPGKKQPPLNHNFKMAPSLKKTAKVERHLDITQAHVVIGFHAPPSNHEQQLAVNILDRIFGSGMNPLLRSMLFWRGRSLVYSVSTQYISLQYGGAFLIHLTLDPKNLKQARWELMKFLSNAWSFKYSVGDYSFEERTDSTDYLETARSAIKTSFQEFQEQGIRAAVNYARYILYYKDIQSEKKQEPYMKRVEKIKSSHIRDAVSRYFSGKKYVAISILPEKKSSK
jgi:zinc protease